MAFIVVGIQTRPPISAMVSAKRRLAVLARMQPSIWPWVTSTRAVAPCSAAMAQITSIAMRRAGPSAPSSMARSCAESVSSATAGDSSGRATPSAIRAPSVNSAFCAAIAIANASALSRTTGTGRSNIRPAIMAPRVTTSSASRNTNAAGAMPFSARSSITPLPLHDPRVVGITSTFPASDCPQRG